MDKVVPCVRRCVTIIFLQCDIFSPNIWNTTLIRCGTFLYVGRCCSLCFLVLLTKVVLIQLPPTSEPFFFVNETSVLTETFFLLDKNKQFAWTTSVAKTLGATTPTHAAGNDGVHASSWIEGSPCVAIDVATDTSLLSGDGLRSAVAVDDVEFHARSLF